MEFTETEDTIICHGIGNMPSIHVLKEDFRARFNLPNAILHVMPTTSGRVILTRRGIWGDEVVLSPWAFYTLYSEV